MQMKKPPHPGRIVRQECLDPLNLTVTEAAELLGVNRNTLNCQDLTGRIPVYETNRAAPRATA